MNDAFPFAVGIEALILHGEKLFEVDSNSPRRNHGQMSPQKKNRFGGGLLLILTFVKSNAAKQEQLVAAPSLIPQLLELQNVSTSEEWIVNDLYIL